VKLDGDVIHGSTAIAWSAAGVALGEGGSQPLVSDLTKRTIGIGSSRVLRFIFEKETVKDAGQYAASAWFGAGCELPVLA